MNVSSNSLTSYLPPEVIDFPGKWLVTEDAAGPEDVFLFFNRVEIGRYHEKRRLPGMLLVHDQTVSSRHCVITQEPDGRCYIRDTSRNGTRVDGRRLTPNLQTELGLGQVLSIGRDLKLRLDGTPPSLFAPVAFDSDTQGVAESNIVTVLVGDIRNYTNLVRMADPGLLQESVNRVFGRLEAEVQNFGGTLKEFQGDALFAFWEKGTNGCHASQACHAALHLEKTVRKLAADPTVWSVAGFPLQMDFALATGLVTISGYGSDGALSLSMVGESVVLAFRIEKYANKKTGPIIVCPITRQIADQGFKFKSLGKHRPKGFEKEQDLYSLLKEKAQLS
jgi:class 3 adenylate cyclase